MAATNSVIARTEKVALRKLWRVALLAGAVSAVANAIFYIIANALGAIPATVLIQPMNQPITIAPVIMSSSLSAIPAAIVLALLNAFTRQPIRLFHIVAVVVLALSFIQPFFIPGAPASMIIVLELMHVVAAIAITGILTTMARVPGNPS